MSKQDIGVQKQDIDSLKRPLVLPDELSPKAMQHIYVLFREYGYENFFGRTEVMQLLGITASPASALIRKMVDLGIIIPIRGKGKYLFS